MGTIVLNAFLSYIKNNPKEIERLIGLLVQWAIGQLVELIAAQSQQSAAALAKPRQS